MKPAVNGTLAILKGAKLHKIKRVVITSSATAIYFSKELKDKYTDEDWSDPSIVDPLSKSKIFSEKIAWTFVKNLKKDEKFELVSINPGFIIGPSIKQTNFLTGDLIKNFMVGSMSIPHIQYPVVDVRDAAEAHLKAVEIEEAKGKRFILISEILWLVEIGEILNKKYGYYYNVNSTEISKCMQLIASLFSDYSQ